MIKRTLSLLCALTIFISMLSSIFALDNVEVANFEEIREVDSVTASNEIVYNSIDYKEYLEINNAIPKAQKDIIIDENSFESYSSDFSKNGYIILPEDGTIDLSVNVPENSMYQIEIEYCPMEGRASAVEIAVDINGHLLFSQSGRYCLERIWKDETETVISDTRGNDIRPKQVEFPRWSTYRLADSAGYYVQPFLYSLIQGKNVITLRSIREPVKIKNITLIAPQKNITYKQYEEAHPGSASTNTIRIQAEQTYWKTDPTLVPIPDRLSSLTEPNKGSKISRNMIGGDRWSMPGQILTWRFVVDEPGDYEIRLRSRQNYSEGFYSTRTLLLDGETPFEEVGNIKFTYSPNWQITVLGNEEGSFHFYLEAGSHELSLVDTLGNFGNVLGKAQNTITTLNSMYRKLLMVMSSSPDELRDYKLDIQLPQVLDEMGKQAIILDNIYDELKKASGFSGGDLAILKKLSLQMKDFNENPEEIAGRFQIFKDNIASMSTWILNAKRRPLDIDWIDIAEPGSSLPLADSTFFEQMFFSFQMFIASFFENYDALDIGNQNGEVSLKVWTATGRDQAQILNDLIRSDFSPKTGIMVNLQLVQPDAILPSTVVGNGPDILMQVGMQMPVNFATRNAAVDLSNFNNFTDIIKRFPESAVTPARFNGGVYGLPEQETYAMLFYRKDILEELKINVPQTWDDLLSILPDLQQNNMDFLVETGMSSRDLMAATVDVGMTTLSMFILQNGGQLYMNDGMECGLSSEISINAFKYWTKLYTNYGLPTNFNIANRFRTGESPIAISDYQLFNTLMVSAPEIKGLWEMVPVPGIRKADGRIDRSVRGISSYCMMTKTADDTESAWEFMDWWTSTETQINYARDMESVLGASARYPTANIEAFKQLPWSLKDYLMLEEQLKWVKGIEEVPGGYYMARHINNAFRDVVIAGNSPRETLLDYTLQINSEITEKRKEFGLRTASK